MRKRETEKERGRARKMDREIDRMIERERERDVSLPRHQSAADMDINHKGRHPSVMRSEQGIYVLH